MENGTQKPTIQITGFRNQEKMTLVELLQKLDCIFIDTEQYRNCTHLIAKQPCKSEKFLAACAAGKWVLTKDYIINSAESGRWLDETTYEWGYKIEKGCHFSPQMQSAPKRWREELTHTGAAGAFHRWKVVVLVVRGGKRRESLIRVLEAGKATIYSTLNVPRDITHLLTNTALNQEREKHLFGAPCYPVYYLGFYLLENEIQNDITKCQENNLKPEQEAKELIDIRLCETKNALIKHMYLQQAMLSKYTQIVQINEFRKEVNNTCWSGGITSILEELADDHLFPIAVTEFLCGKDLIPPVKFFHPLLEHMLQGNADPILSVHFFHIMYTLLQHEPPWKSSSMLKYYLEVLQCPVCMKGTWPLMEMLVRSCLYCNNICHSIPASEAIAQEERLFHKRLLKFILNLLQAEVLALKRSVCERVESQPLQVMPQTVLLNIFWSESESVLFTKRINILVDWIINAFKEKCKTNDIFRHEVADLLNGILGAVVEYWILSGFTMDRNVLQPVANDLATYIVLSCDDFSTQELKTFISSIPSLWLEMFVAEAIFKKLSFLSKTSISAELLSLQKLVFTYLPALQAGLHETGKMQEAKKKKTGQWPCPESPEALLMLSGDKQNLAKVLPDVPGRSSRNWVRVPKKLGNAAAVEMSSNSKENCRSSAKRMNIYKINVKGETVLHNACKRNNVKKLIHHLSEPGGIDINVKDYAGWTPLHEACNHGSTVCVREILQRCPEVDLLSQVDGMTPLHDALSNGHVEIAKILLQHGGPELLKQVNCQGKLPLDYIQCVATKQSLLHIVKPEESVEDFHAEVKHNFFNQQTEFWTVLFSKMLLNFCSVYNLFTPFSLTIKKLAYSNPLLMTAGSCKFSTCSHTHWFVDLYCKELESFQNLPQYLKETIKELNKCHGEQHQAFAATLEQVTMAMEMSSSYLAGAPPN